MTTIRYARTTMLAGLLAITVGCQGPNTSSGEDAPQAAVVTILPDLSGSTAFQSSPAYADAAIRRAGQVVADQQLGDRVRVLPLGSRTGDRAVETLTLASDRKLRLPAMRRRVEASLSELLATSRQDGGDGATNILYTLENAQVVCTPRSKLVLLSDGIEDSDAYSVVRAMGAGRPIQLPPPGTAYLKGCSVELIGIGISPQSGSGSAATTLPNTQLQALTAAWREYFAAAGVEPDAMRFVSIL